MFPVNQLCAVIVALVLEQRTKDPNDLGLNAFGRRTIYLFLFSVLAVLAVR